VAPDQPARDRIVEDLGSTLFVEAGAGSGKTSALVDRILALVGSGSVELQSLAAITFTERAAAELRYRLRRKLEERAEQTTEVEVADRYRLALEQLDAAAVGTLHAFAQRLLTEHPIEAGLPPRLEVLDEVSSAVAFDERWRVFLDELLADVSLGRPLLLLEACGVRVEDLPAVASVFEDNWDLVAERATDAGGSVPSVQPMVAPVFAEIRDICATQCLDPGDALRRRLNEVGDWATRTAAIADEVELLTALDREGDPKPPSFRARSLGRSGNYRCDVTELRQRLLAAGELIDEVRAQVAQACIVQLEARIKAFTLKAARERRQAGALEFHDLLVLARELLRDRRHGPAVRSRLHERYRRLLLDESQDTDPIQLELAVRIAAAEPEAEATGSAPWVDLEVSPGQLFFVGDPKQSIYRFRRADIAMFLAAKERFGDDIGGLVELTANFRTTEPVIEWVNAVFGRLLIPSAGSGLPVESQPSYVPLQAVRPEAPAGPPVTVLGREEHPKGPSAGSSPRPGMWATRRNLRGGGRLDWTTSPWSYQPELRCRSSKTPSRRWASPIGPSRAPSSMPPGRCGMYSWCCAPSTTRPTPWTWCLPSARRFSDVATTTCSASRSSGKVTGTTSATSRRASPRTTRWAGHSVISGPCTTSDTGSVPPSCWIGSPPTDGPSSSASPRVGPAMCGAVCASSSTRRGPGTRRRGAIFASTCTGWSPKRSTGPGWRR
jgi:hypothetical protein